MKASSKGIVSELKAITWFLEQNWEVFHNVKPNGPADFVIWKQGMVCPILVDVKTVNVYIKADGSESYVFAGLGNKDWDTAKKNTKDNIHYLGYCPQKDTFLWFDEDPTESLFV